MYSGPTAAHGFYHLASDGIPEVLVIVGPCHQRAAMVPAAIQTHGAWLTPLGQTPIDTDAATAIAQAWDGFGLGARYFWAEHSLEVQLPFLQHLYGERLRIVPVLIVDQNNYTAREVGRALAEGLQGRDAVIVASTDLSHYVPAAVAEHRDGQLIDRILALDPEGLMRLAREPQMSMCGFGPVAAMLHAATALGAQQAIKLSYTHSGMTYPAAEVVGYVSIMIRR
jgi:AmmeMemoRadiSam system protein B